MQVSYEHNMSNNYLVLENETKGAISKYQRNLLRLNQVCGLMKTEIREVDKQVYYYYDMNEKTSLLTVVGKQCLEYEEVKTFFESCIHTIEGAKTYLMQEDNFILLPEFVFFADESHEVQLCYMDGYQKGIRQQFYELVEFLLNHINYKDQSCVRMVYELFQLLGKENTTFQEMKRVIEGGGKGQTVESLCKEEEPSKKDSTLVREAQTWENEQTKEQTQHIYVQDDPKWKKIRFNHKWLMLGGLTGIAFVLIVVVASLGLLNEKGSNRMDALKCIAFFGLIGSILVYFYMKIAPLEKESMKKEPLCHPSYMETEQICETREGCRLKDCNQMGNPDLFIREFPYLLGKDKNQVNGIIQSDVISRVHAKITVANGQFYIEDLHSTNGTFVNGQRIKDRTPFLLQEQDEVMLGNVRYLFLLDE